MKIKQIARSGSIIDDLLTHYRVKDTEGFKTGQMRFRKSDLLKREVAGFKDAVGYVLAGIDSKVKFGLLVDDDADGFTSSAILYMYMKDIDPEVDIQVFHHRNKAHGLTEEIVDQMQAAQLDIILVPDAGANDVLKHNELTFCGSKVIVIDHHIIEPLPKTEDGQEIQSQAIIVSNQNPANPKPINKSLTGAGMVLRFCEAIDVLLKTNFAEQYYDLAAVGQIGDASNISQPEIHSIVMKGMANINSPFLKQSIGDHAFKDIAPPGGMSFSVIPMINAITRVGTVEEKRELFEAMTDKNEPEIVIESRRRKNKETGKFEMRDVEFTTMKLKVDSFMKIKARQANLVKKALEVANYRNATGSVAIVELEDFDEKIGGVTGLIANKIVSRLQMPTLVLVKREDEMMGSGRGFEKKIKDLRKWVHSTKLAEWAIGHDNAFGTSIHIKNFDKFLEKAAKETSKSSAEREFEVIETHINRVVQPPLLEAIENDHLYGGTVARPLFYFENIEVKKDSISIMAGGTCISWWSQGITFIAFGLPADSGDAFSQGFKNSFNMNFVGSPSLSNWRGKETLQVIVEEYEFYDEDNATEVEDDSFIF